MEKLEITEKIKEVWEFKNYTRKPGKSRGIRGQSGKSQGKLYQKITKIYLASIKLLVSEMIKYVFYASEKVREK